MISMIESFLPSLRLSKNSVITSKDPPMTLKSSLTTRILRYSKKPESCHDDRLDGLCTSLVSTSPSLTYPDNLWVNLMPSLDDLTMKKATTTMKIVSFFPLLSSIKLFKLTSLPPPCSTVRVAHGYGTGMEGPTHTRTHEACTCMGMLFFFIWACPVLFFCLFLLFLIYISVIFY